MFMTTAKSAHGHRRINCGEANFPRSAPVYARFLQADPLGYEDDMNLYAYVGADPVNFTDPSGLCTAKERQNGCVRPINPNEDRANRDIVVTGTRLDLGERAAEFARTLDVARWFNNPAASSGSEGQEIVVTGTRPPKPNTIAVPSSREIPPGVHLASDQSKDQCGTGSTGGLVPDSLVGTNIRGACSNHDACYASATDREVCDRNLMTEIIRECQRQSQKSGCYAGAIIYYFSLRIFGSGPYKRAQRGRFQR